MKAVNSIPATQFDMRKSVEVQVGGDFAVYLPSGVYEIKKMEPRKRLRSIAFVCLLLAVAGIIGFGYFCPDQVGIICRNVLSIRFLIDQMFFDYFFLSGIRLKVCALSKRELPVAAEWSAITNSFTNNYGKVVHQTSLFPGALPNPGLSYEDVLNEDFQFDMNGHDVMVFLHIQKTGGTSFGRHLVMDLDLKVI